MTGYHYAKGGSLILSPPDDNAMNNRKLVSATLDICNLYEINITNEDGIT